MTKRIILIVMDSVGIGEMPDSVTYGDQGSNTIANISEAIGGLLVSNLQELGLANIVPIPFLSPSNQPIGNYGKMEERSKGKDTTTGHWEIAGIVLEKAFPTFPNGFPIEFIDAFEKRIGRKVIGNEVASGTEIIERLGSLHMNTGHPIVYTSVDSVFQIAAHEEIVPLEDLMKICEIAREMLVDHLRVSRVIARPFLGREGSFQRTSNRHDFSVEPVSDTVLDEIIRQGLKVIAVGKINDIFAGRGISSHVLSKGNMDGIDKTLELMKQAFSGLLFINLVDFDMLYGHRNNIEGYAQALKEFDQRLPELLSALGDEDILIITADHGCDPTTSSTDHSREYVPILVYGRTIQKGKDLGIRSTFADISATIAEYLEIDYKTIGTSFYTEIKEENYVK